MDKQVRKAKLSRREFLRGAAAGTAWLALEAPLGCSTPSKPRGPNILLILSNDHGKWDCGCYGNPFVATPNIDYLASQGTRFQSAFAVAAICVPSRSCLITGLYPHTNGAFGFGEIEGGAKTLPAYLRSEGYYTGCVGKLHVKPPERIPFDRYVPDKKLAFGRDIQAYREEVRRFFKENRQRPFFLQVGFSDPHRPFPTQGIKKGKSREVPDPHDLKKVWVPPYLADLPEVRAELAQYYDAIKRLDQGVGYVLQELESAGLAENTLVIYTTDHGSPFPFSKTTLYDAGLNVPFLVRWPGIVSPGATSEALVHLIDLVPTFLAAAGAESPPSLQGKSFLPLLEGSASAIRDSVFGSQTEHYFSPACPSRSIRGSQYHYIYNFAPANEFRSDSQHGSTWNAMVLAGEKDRQLAERLLRLVFRPSEELFDTREDPFELVNLAEYPSHRDTKKRMYQKLKATMEEINDPWLSILLEQEKLSKS